jgi:hypothetical protein
MIESAYLNYSILHAHIKGDLISYLVSLHLTLLSSLLVCRVIFLKERGFIVSMLHDFKVINPTWKDAHVLVFQIYMCASYFWRYLVHVMRLHCLVAHSLPYTKAIKHKARACAAIGYSLSLWASHDLSRKRSQVVRMVHKCKLKYEILLLWRIRDLKGQGMYNSCVYALIFASRPSTC